MNGTQDRILDSAMGLLQSRGYSAISYQDISDEVGIRKASIHYYFPSKGDLAQAVVHRYRAEVQDVIKASETERGADYWGLLDDYFHAYLIFEEEPHKICLCGSLAGEYPVLPELVQVEVDGFFADQLAWIIAIMKKLQEASLISPEADTRMLSGWVLSSMQGALMIGRATGEMQRVIDAKHLLISSLKAF